MVDTVDKQASNNNKKTSHALDTESEKLKMRKEAERSKKDDLDKEHWLYAQRVEDE